MKRESKARRGLKSMALIVLLAWTTIAFASDYFIVAGGHMQASCGTLQFALESSPSSGIRVTRLNAGSGITGRVPMPLFELTLCDDSGERHTLRSNEGWQQVNIRKMDGQSCLLELSRPMPMTGGELSLAVEIRLMNGGDDEPCLTFTWTESKVPTGWTLERTVLLPLHFGPLSEGTFFFYPYCSGMLCEPAKESIERMIAYPSGFGASMGWYALYGEDGGIYFAAHDPEATIKHLYMKTTPGTGLEMWFDYPATEPVGGQSLPAPANLILAPLKGDWFDGAMRYRRWVRREANWYPRDKMGPQGRTDSPQWMKELSLWVNGGPSEVMSFQRTLGVPMGFHWYCWHQIPFDNDYPHYFPARQGFRKTVSDMQASSIYVMPYINGRLWDTRDSGTRDSLFSSLAWPCVTKQRDGSIITESYRSKEADGSDVVLGVMCPQTEVWRSKMKEVVLGLCGPVEQGGFGTKAVYMDQIAAAHPVNCFDASHGHPLGGGSWWTSAYRGMLEDIRASKPANVALTTESNADGYVDLFDGFLVWQFWHNGQVPAFGAVYGGSIQLFGRSYASTKALDFKMALAQSFVWGEQIGWFKANDFLHSVPFITNIFPFLRQVVSLRYKFSPYFYMGEMVRAPRLVGENPEQVGNWQLEDMTQQVKNPAVMCGAWTIPSQQSTLLLFANYSTKDVCLNLEYPLAEWNIEEGSYAVARYDSDSFRKPLETLPSEVIFHSNEAFVLEITSQNSSGIGGEQKVSKLQKTYYDLLGCKLDKPQKGIDIIRYSDETSRKVLIK